MGKKRKLSHVQGNRVAKPQRKGPTTTATRLGSLLATSPVQKQTKKQDHHQPSQDAAIVPFAPKHRIFLVGEADLSFAASLVTHHGCAAKLTATVLERDAAELEEKYPETAKANMEVVTTAGGRVLYGIDVRTKGPLRIPGKSSKSKKRKKLGGDLDDLDVNIAPPTSLAASDNDDGCTFDRIVFNFPHVGGKSTDVNRQVRYNQELLVSFFERAKPSLAPGGAIIVTVFEGEPYTLWNVRDLGRHCGLRVERSFRFRADAYPGYRHSRTLGVVRNQKTGEEAKSAWRGEDKPARSFVFVRKEDEGVQIEGVSFAPKKKRRRDDDDSNDDEDEEEYTEGDEGDEWEGLDDA